MKGNLTRSERKEEKRLKEIDDYETKSVKSLTVRQKFILKSYGLITGGPLLLAAVIRIPDILNYLSTSDIGLKSVEESSFTESPIIETILTVIFYASFSVTFSFSLALLLVASINKNSTDDEYKLTDNEYKFFVQLCTVVILALFWGLAIAEYTQS